MEHLKPRTVREWLELIPFENARKLAIENYDDEYAKECGSLFCNSLSSSFGTAFIWGGN